MTTNPTFIRIEELREQIPHQEAVIQSLLSEIDSIQSIALASLESAETEAQKDAVKAAYAISIEGKFEQLDAEFATYEALNSELSTLLSSLQDPVSEYNEKLLGRKINSQIKIKSL